MGVRQRSYWLRQVEAIRRQNIAAFAYAVGLGMADQKSSREAFDALELTQTAKESKKQLSDSWWGLTKLSKRLMKLSKGGRGV